MKFDLFTPSDLRIVEFNTTGSEQEFSRVNDNSVFLDASVFNIFLPCFESVKLNYSYFGANCFTELDIQKLNLELAKSKDEIEKIASDDEFIDFLSNKMLSKQFMLNLESQDKHWIRNWKTYTDKLSDINRKLIRITDNCLEDAQILWVIGY